MLTGLGSKYHILQEFQKQALVGENCMIVNGFNPSFSLSEFVSLLCDRLFAFNREGMRQDVMVGILTSCSHTVIRSTSTMFAPPISCLHLDS